jgi:hypothetical protein
MGQLIRTLVYLPIRQGFVSKHDCDGVGPDFGLGFENRVDRLIPRIIRRGLIPLDDDLFPFGLA